MGTAAFTNRLEGGFKNGMALVQVNWEWGVVDTNGTFIIKPKYEDVDEIGFIDNYFFYKIDHPDPNSNYDNLIGVASIDSSINIAPIMEDFDRGGFKNGLLQCIINGSLAYLDKKGNVVWKNNNVKNGSMTDMNIDRMNRGYFYAYSRPNKQDLGGYGGSANVPKQITSDKGFESKTLKVIVRPNERDTFYKTYNGIKAYVYNQTKRNIEFNAQDSRLYMTVQALDKNGTWKNIEYSPSSWCGNSYHILTLDTNQYWSFVVPDYVGEFKTKLRIELRYIDPNDKSDKRWDKKELIIYSNEYDGSVNPGQFWRKENYYPNGIMDPYND